MSEIAPRLLVGLLPVVLFLLALIFLDSYSLVRPKTLLATIATGGVVAAGAYVVNVSLMPLLGLEPGNFTRYVAPLVEESAKALFVIHLIRSHRVGFLVDTAIYAFAVGAGFALVENLYYLQALQGSHLVVWIFRGFGTAIMHGGATAIFGIVSKTLADREDLPRGAAFLPGLFLAWSIHSAFNHFFLSPILSALGILLILPPLLSYVFHRSELSLRQWLNVGFDADTEMLELIMSGDLSESRVGFYLESLKRTFRLETVGDLLCYLRVYLELSLRAKGLLMMREQGFSIELDEETRESFAELAYLEKSVGRTGKLALSPFLHAHEKELWQLQLLAR